MDKKRIAASLLCAAFGLSALQGAVGFSHAGYLGGTDDDTAFAVATDSNGNIYIAGGTRSADFPVANALQPVKGGGEDPIDAFLTKLSPDGQTILYSTFLGGSNLDEIRDIAVDDQGRVLLVGVTQSSDFPTVNALQPSCRITPELGCRDAFAARLNAAGTALEFSTFLGGGSLDSAHAVALGQDGSLYIAGETFSDDFPVTEGAYQETFAGDRDAFVVKLSPDGQNLIYATYLGGSDTEQAADLAVAATGQAVVAGLTFSPDLATTPGAFQAAFGGLIDSFVIRLTSDGREAVFSTYLGGSAGEAAGGLALDAQGNVHLAGTTGSDDFPTTENAAFTLKSASVDAFAVKLDAGGTQLLYSTFLGGNAGDSATGAVLDAEGRLWMTGRTSSADFPQVHPLQDGYGGNEDAFAALLSADGSLLLHSTFLGGASNDAALCAAGNGSRSLLLAGFTISADFPTVHPLQGVFAGGSGLGFGAFGGGDAFVARLIERHRLPFAQFGNGDGLSSQVILRNLDSGNAARVELLLRGNDGAPLTVDLNGTEAPGRLEAEIPPAGLLSLTTDGEGGLTAGSALALSDRPLAGVILFGGANGLAGVGSSLEATRFIAPMLRDATAQINTGIAVQNLSEQSVEVALRLLDADGALVAESSASLAALGHRALFLTEIDWTPAPDLDSFRGSLEASSDGPIAATVLQTRPGQLASLPVAVVDQ